MIAIWLGAAQIVTSAAWLHLSGFPNAGIVSSGSCTAGAPRPLTSLFGTIVNHQQPTSPVARTALICDNQETRTTVTFSSGTGEEPSDGAWLQYSHLKTI